MRVIKIDSSRCKGCFLCVSVCPSEALAPSGILGPKGYETVVVDDTKCIKCGSCYKMCPDYVIEILDA